MLNEAFTLAEVQQALRKLNNCKAVGLSGEPAELLRCATLKSPDGKVENAQLPALKTIFNAAFLWGEIPDQWHTSIMTPIHKNGGATDTCVRSLYSELSPHRGGRACHAVVGHLAQ